MNIVQVGEYGIIPDSRNNGVYRRYLRKLPMEGLWLERFLSGYQIIVSNDNNETKIVEQFAMGREDTVVTKDRRTIISKDGRRIERKFRLDKKRKRILRIDQDLGTLQMPVNRFVVPGILSTTEYIFMENCIKIVSKCRGVKAERVFVKNLN